ncbi:MAG TPA: hypothetical protein VGB30_04510 [bacterium]|jgi:hypothetical protein
MAIQRLLSSFAILIFLLSTGCGGGGGSSSGTIHGILVDAFGAIISSNQASISVTGGSTIATPDANGNFTLQAPAGSQTLTASLTMVPAGIRLRGSKVITVVEGQTTQVGEFVISDDSLSQGWNAYTTGQYFNAENLFLSYLDTVKSAQADFGSTSAYVGLGWTRARGLNKASDASNDFMKAIDGYQNNADAWVGLAGSELSRMKKDGGFHFNQAINAINSAINIPGNYSSAPTHDLITELDLRAYRSFLNYLNGNEAVAKSEANEISQSVATDGSNASGELLSVVIAFSD